MNRLLALSLGGALVLTGAILAPLPGPLGTPFTLGGLVLLLRNSLWVRKTYVRCGRRWPWGKSFVDRLLRRRREKAAKKEE